MSEIFWEIPDTGSKAVKYDVYRNGEFLVQTDGRSLMQPNLALGDLYSYELYAIDANGQKSDAATFSFYQSRDPAVQVGDHLPDDAGNLQVNNLRYLRYGPKVVELFWDRIYSTDVVYQIYNGGVFLTETDGTSFFHDYSSTGLYGDYIIEAHDSRGGTSEPARLSLDTVDLEPDVDTSTGAIQNPMAYSYGDLGNELFWRHLGKADPTVKSVTIFRNGEFLAETDAQFSFFDDSPPLGESSVYTLVANQDAVQQQPETVYSNLCGASDSSSISVENYQSRTFDARENMRKNILQPLFMAFKASGFSPSHILADSTVTSGVSVTRMCPLGGMADVFYHKDEYANNGAGFVNIDYQNCQTSEGTLDGRAWFRVGQNTLEVDFIELQLQTPDGALFEASAAVSFDIKINENAAWYVENENIRYFHDIDATGNHVSVYGKNRHLEQIIRVDLSSQYLTEQLRQGQTSNFNAYPEQRSRVNRRYWNYFDREANAWPTWTLEENNSHIQSTDGSCVWAEEKSGFRRMDVNYRISTAGQNYLVEATDSLDLPCMLSNSLFDLFSNKNRRDYLATGGSEGTANLVLLCD